MITVTTVSIAPYEMKTAFRNTPKATIVMGFSSSDSFSGAKVLLLRRKPI